MELTREFALCVYSYNEETGSFDLEFRNNLDLDQEENEKSPEDLLTSMLLQSHISENMIDLMAIVCGEPQVYSRKRQSKRFVTIGTCSTTNESFLKRLSEHRKLLLEKMEKEAKEKQMSSSIQKEADDFVKDLLNS